MKKVGCIFCFFKVIVSGFIGGYNVLVSYGFLEFLDSLLIFIVEGGEKSCYLAIVGEVGFGKIIFL